MIDRLDQLLINLETDQAISEAQLRRHYALEIPDLKADDFTLVKAFLAPSQGSFNYRKVTFIGLSSKLKRLEASSLRHLAGIAEMRRILAADTNNWTSLAAARRQPHKPDALWVTARGLVGIEYDIGSYSPVQISEKARSFKRYAWQVWGTPSGERAKHLRFLLRQVDCHYEVYRAGWC